MKIRCSSNSSPSPILSNAPHLRRLESLDSRVTRLEPLPTLFQQLDANTVKKDAYDQQLQQIEDVLKRLQDTITRYGMQLRDHDEALRNSSANAAAALANRQEASDEESTRSRNEWERSLLSRFVERPQYETELASLQDADSHASTEIAKLWSAIRKLKDTDEELREAGEVRDAQIQELRNAIASVGRLVNSITDRINECVARKDLVALRDELVNQVKEAAAALKDHVKKELRRFEKDVIDFVGENVGTQQDNTETAIGKVYFRCLTCNQTTASQHGPHSRMYQAAMGIPSIPPGPIKVTGTPNSIPTSSPGGLAASAIGTTPAAALSLIAQGGMLVERGEDLTLHGADGQVYKGRESPIVHFAAPSAAHSASSSPTPGVPRNADTTGFRVGYVEKERGSVHSLSRKVSARSPRLPEITDQGSGSPAPALGMSSQSASESVGLITAGPATGAISTTNAASVTGTGDASPVPQGVATGVLPSSSLSTGFAATTTNLGVASESLEAARKPRLLRPATSTGTRK